MSKPITRVRGIGLRVRSVVEGMPDLTHEVIEGLGCSSVRVHIIEDCPGGLLDLFDLSLVLSSLRDGDKANNSEDDGQRREHGFSFQRELIVLIMTRVKYNEAKKSIILGF